MARISHFRAMPSTVAVNESVFYWLFALLCWASIVYFVLVGMGRTRQNKGKGTSSRYEEAEEDDEDYEMEENEGNGEDDEEDEEAANERNMEFKAWVESVNNRKFVCERQFDIAGVEHPAIKVIQKQKLNYFFWDLKGFRESLVRGFYITMEIVNNNLITSTMGEVEVEVTPDAIARVMGYERPRTRKLTWPREGRVFSDTEIVNALTDNPNCFKKGRFKPGQLNETAKLLNKIVHTNLMPHGSESSPSMAEATLLYVLMKIDEKVDWSRYIFDQIVAFRRSGSSSFPARIPFPCLITTLCEKAGVACADTDVKNFHGCEQAINKTSISKSKAMSGPPMAGSSSRPSAKGIRERMDQWGDTLMGNIGDLRIQVGEVQASNSRLEESNRRMERHMQYQMKHNERQERWTKHLMDNLPEEDRYAYTDEEDLGGSE